MFKFKPLDYVKIISYGLNYHGRVIRCILEDRDIRIYDCDFAAEGQFLRRECYEDEITGSSNGRTEDFDSSNVGSSPAPVAKHLLC